MSKDKLKTKGKPDSVDVHVGKRLRVRRSLLGLSQEKLAEAIGLTFQQVQKYERGVNRISAGRLYQFSKILDVPIAYFYEQVKGMTPSNAMGMSDNVQEGFGGGEDTMQDKETLKLIKAYYEIDNPDLRQDVLKFIKSVGARTSKSDD